MCESARDATASNATSANATSSKAPPPTATLPRPRPQLRLQDRFVIAVQRALTQLAHGAGQAPFASAKMMQKTMQKTMQKC